MTTLIHEVANVDHQLAHFRRRFPKLVLGTGVPFIVAAVILVPFLPLVGQLVFGGFYLVWVLAMVRYINRLKSAGERLLHVAEEQGVQARQAVTAEPVTPGRRRRGAWIWMAAVSSVVWAAYVLAVYPLLDPPFSNIGLTLVVVSYVGLQLAIWASRPPQRPAGDLGHG